MRTALPAPSAISMARLPSVSSRRMVAPVRLRSSLTLFAASPQRPYHDGVVEHAALERDEYLVPNVGDEQQPAVLACHRRGDASPPALDALA
jgi:hypothetical protein